MNDEMVNTMNVELLTDNAEKQAVVREILEALPEWFELEEGRETYIRECTQQLCFGAYANQRCIGFLCLKETSKATVELAVTGVLKQYHRQGIGRMLFDAAKQEAQARGYAFMQVKTVKMGVYPEYDDTNRFYLALGFQEFEVIPSIWDEANPCQIYVMSLH